MNWPLLVVVIIAWALISNWSYRQLRLQVKKFGAQVGVYIPDTLLSIVSFIPLVWVFVGYDWVVRKVRGDK